MAEPTEDQIRSRRSRPRLRTLEPTTSERHASWLELFFDLVFVLAVSRASQLLAGETDAAGFLKFALIFAPIWYSWIGFTFYADRFETEEIPYRLLMFSGMASVTGLSLTVGGAFSADGILAFIICYVLVRLVLIALYSRAAYHVPLARAYCSQFIIGLGISSALALISLLVDPPFRYVIWVASFVVELSIPFINRRITRAIPVDRSHIPERFGLFTIIVLGEAVIATANGAGSVERTVTAVVMACIGFSIAASIWWITFDFVSDESVGFGTLTRRFIYLYGHLFVVASIVVVGIGVEHAIKESAEQHLHLPTLALLAGGSAAFLSAITVVRMVTGVCKTFVWRLVAIAITLLVIPVGSLLPPIVSLLVVAAVMLGTILIESRFFAKVMITSEAGPPHLLPCEHSDQILVLEPRSHDGCEECRKNNYKWVHLRLCLGCGHVGCCDSSIHKHATKHFLKVGHPIIASLEAGEDWAWCYLDERFVPFPREVETRL